MPRNCKLQPRTFLFFCLSKIVFFCYLSGTSFFSCSFRTSFFFQSFKTVSFFFSCFSRIIFSYLSRIILFFYSAFRRLLFFTTFSTTTIAKWIKSDAWFLDRNTKTARDNCSDKTENYSIRGAGRQVEQQTQNNTLTIKKLFQMP